MAEGSPLRVLLAEDNPTNQKVARLMLGQLGYTTDLAVNGREAVDLVSSKGYDVVIMDVQMPVMDGLEAASEIRRRFPDAARRPRIIAMTANAMVGDRERCIESGMDDYVAKPIRIDHLRAALERAASGRAGAQPDLKSAPPEQPVFDPDMIIQMLPSDVFEAEELARQLGASFFLDDAPCRFERIVGAIRKGDARTAARESHSLKGASGTLGMARVFAVCNAIEQSAKAGDIAGALSHSQGLAASIQAARFAFDDWMAGRFPVAAE